MSWFKALNFVAMKTKAEFYSETSVIVYRRPVIIRKVYVLIKRTALMSNLTYISILNGCQRCSWRCMGGVGMKIRPLLFCCMTYFKIRMFESQERCPQTENLGNTRWNDGGMDIIYRMLVTDVQLVKNFPELVALLTAVSHYNLESVKFR